MLLDSVLVGAHISCILAMIVFQTSLTAICRPAWFNGAVIARLYHINKIYLACMTFTLCSGICLMLWGKHGILTGVYFLQINWILHIKFLIFFLIIALAFNSSLVFHKWKNEFEKTAELPNEKQINRQRRYVLIEAHLLLLMPFMGAFLSNGFGFNP